MFAKSAVIVKTVGILLHTNVEYNNINFKTEFQKHDLLSLLRFVSQNLFSDANFSYLILFSFVPDVGFIEHN